MKMFGGAALAAILVFAAAPAAAEPRQAQQRPTIDVAEVDWRDPAQVSAVEQKIRRAARAWCAAQMDPMVHSRRDLQACIAGTVRDTLAGSGRPQLMARAGS